MVGISFQEQVAVITGAGRGLGRAYALELARRGASVVVNDVGTDEAGNRTADAVVAEIIEMGGAAISSGHDVATAAGGAELIEACMQRFGRLDVLINNAGFLRGSTFDEMEISDLEAVVGIHLLGAFYVTLPAWKAMRRDGYGRIVMTGSSSSFGHSGNSNYSAAKSGMLGLTHSLALEGAPYGIAVNCIFPTAKSQIAAKAPLVGPDRDRIVAALGRLDGHHTPEAVAPMVAFLASRECTVTGHTYSAVAGRYARVSIGLGEGWYGGSKVTVEDVAGLWPAIDAAAPATIPRSLVDELESIGMLVERS